MIIIAYMIAYCGIAIFLVAVLALFLGFGASSLDFRLLVWTADFDNFLRLRSELSTATHDALKEAGITIPFPQRDLHVKSLPSAVDGLTEDRD